MPTFQMIVQFRTEDRNCQVTGPLDHAPLCMDALCEAQKIVLGHALKKGMEPPKASDRLLVPPSAAAQIAAEAAEKRKKEQAMYEPAGAATQ